MAEEKSLRYRVNVSTSVKGVKTYDCTVELTVEGATPILPSVGSTTPIPDAPCIIKELAKSDELVAKLEKRYPIKVEE